MDLKICCWPVPKHYYLNAFTALKTCLHPPLSMPARASVQDCVWCTCCLKDSNDESYPRLATVTPATANLSKLGSHKTRLQRDFFLVKKTLILFVFSTIWLLMDSPFFSPRVASRSSVYLARQKRL